MSGDSKFRQPPNIGARLDEDFADAARAVDAGHFAVQFFPEPLRLLGSIAGNPAQMLGAARRRAVIIDAVQLRLSHAKWLVVPSSAKVAPLR